MSQDVNLLIVDDDRATQRLLADALSKQGFSVTVERDGEWALRTFEKRNFDAVILDILLPAVTGYEVARQIKASPKGKAVPIILISGVYKNAIQQEEAVTKHGAFAFIEKPMHLSKVYAVLRQALGNRYPAQSSEPPAAPADEVGGERLADGSAQQEATEVEVDLKKLASFQSIKGSFDRRPFPEVLAEVYRWKGTGALLLRNAKVKKIVYFRDGVPLSVKSNLLSECLGRVMVRERMISEAECEESLKRMGSSGRQQGTVLVEMGCISPHNLVYGLTLQLQTKLFDVFSWTEGDFQFNPRISPPPETVNLGMTTAAAIYEGVRRRFDAGRVSALLGSVDGLFVHPSENPLYALQDAGLGEEEQQLLQSIDGHKTVATLRALALLSPLDTDRFLYAMKCAGMVELRNEPAEGRPQPSISRLALERSAEPSASAPPSVIVSEVPWSPGPEKVRPPALPPRPKQPPAPPKPVLARAAGTLLPDVPEASQAGFGDEAIIRERLAAKVASLRKLNYFEMLGVSKEASREEIKRAYFPLAKEFHPDKHFGSSSAETRQLAGQIFDLLSRAHDALTDPEERARYLKQMSQTSGRDSGDEVGKILAAEGKFQRGEELMRSKQYVGAHQLFQEAVNLYGDEGEFHAYLGWSLFLSAPDDPRSVDAALAAIERAIHLNPRLDKSYLFIGYIHKATGRPDKAEKHFEKAIQCNPDCTEALRELRILGKARR